MPGVRGWLAFLCISLTILTPLFSAANLVGEWRIMMPYFDTVPNAKEAAMCEVTCFSALTFFALYAGARLWMIKPRAVQTAKLFLVANLIVLIVVPTLTFNILDIQGQWDPVIKATFGGIIYFAVWYPYLCKSMRVKATYA